MAGQLPPGLGNDQQALQATAFIRQQPWYLQWIKGLGKTPDANGNVQLNDSQASQLRDMAVKNGIGLNNKYDGIDSNGQIVEEHHKLRNGLIAAAIAGAGLTGFGAAGIGPLSGMFGAASGAAGAGAGAAGSAAGAGTLASTTIGSGFIPAIAGGAGIPGLSAGAAAGAGAYGVADAALPGLASTGYVSPEVMGAPSSVSSMAGGSSALAGGGSMIDKIMASLKSPSSLADLSRILQQGATDAQGNRILQGNMASKYDQNMLTAQTDRNTNEADAMKKLAQTSYILNGHSGYTPANITTGGGTKALPDFGFGYTGPSDAQKQGATTLQSQLLDRLKPGGSYTPMPFSDYGTPGTGENIQNYTGQGLGIAGTIMNMFKNSGQQ